MSNHLINETSPYLLQHANNPVDWYPWGEEAWQHAREENKPVFLSIGYSTCHWCHVMAHESFEDMQIAELLNQSFISIKVDKEERPDIDSIYMSVCQALTGSGGWPMTIFLTPEQKPFFAGTYFAPTARYGRIGFYELLLSIAEKWKTDRAALVNSANEIVHAVREQQERKSSSTLAKTLTQPELETMDGQKDIRLIDSAVQFFKRTFDEEYGGFGDAPKFPSPHNLLFLMRYFERNRDYGKSDAGKAMEMVEKTLLQMYRGGIFDHIGGGFSRYSTDRYFLVPHFEKMLYDNALLILAYCNAYQLTANVLYRGVAEKTACYVMREMTSEKGGFYSAQDADSEGVEGKFYLFEPIEVMKVLGQKVGKEFCGYFDITSEGNFEGKSIPNLLNNNHISARYNELFCELYEYRRKRYYLHLDDKILTSWNGLMIAAMCALYRVTEKKEYLATAQKALAFMEKYLCDGTSSHAPVLYVSFRKGGCSGTGFLDDYANMVFALLALYGATLDKGYLKKADEYCKRAIADFWDEEHGGFFLSGRESESLFMRPKETYDGAVPSGNSMMAYNLVWMQYLVEDNSEADGICYKEIAEKQLLFMKEAASSYPAGYAMALLAQMDYNQMPDKITVVLGEDVTCEKSSPESEMSREDIACRIPLGTIVHVLEEPTEGYPRKNHTTTYYVCKGNTCYPPENDLESMVGNPLSQ